jgi:hypothetical protein
MLFEAVWVCCSCGGREGALTLAHEQPSRQQHRRCRRSGPWRGAAGQHDAHDAGVRLGMWVWMWMLFEAFWVCCSYGGREGAPRPWPVLTLAHGQPSFQQHRRCRRAGPGCGAAGQHDADDAGVRLGCGCGYGCDLRRYGCVEVSVAEREPTTFASAHTCSWAALKTTRSALRARGTFARRCRSTRR